MRGAFSIPPLFKQKLYNLYKHSLRLTGFAKVPFTDITVRIAYDFSAAVVLCGLPQSREHERAALGKGGGPNNVGGGALLLPLLLRVAVVGVRQETSRTHSSVAAFQQA